jgi:cytochrome c-type biogenesis protein CcmH/NrfG
MTRDSLALLLSGTFFGVLVGWIIGSQQAAPSVPAPAPAPVVAESAAPSNTPAAPPRLDTARVSQLEQQAKASPSDAAVRTELGNLYFDGERYDQAIQWYDAALKLDPKNVNVSTDLAVAFYYTNQTDQALKQLNYSLSVDPRHLKSLLNQGIVLAFGKQDLAGAQKAWERVVAIAPDSEEGKKAAQGLEGLRAHATAAAAAPAGGSAP